MTHLLVFTCPTSTSPSRVPCPLTDFPAYDIYRIISLPLCYTVRFWGAANHNRRLGYPYVTPVAQCPTGNRPQLVSF